MFEAADHSVARHKLALGDTLEIAYVPPDYSTGRPKPCMHGWAQRTLCITPRGDVLPCHAAQSIPGMRFDNLRYTSLAEIWRHSAALEKYRGVDWLPEPCRSCPEQALDFGGCRCQAFLLAGDASRTDPACSLAPDHSVVVQARTQAASATVAPVYCTRRNALALLEPSLAPFKGAL